MKRPVVIVLALLLPLAGAAQRAEDILNKTAAIYHASNGATATFSLRTHSANGSNDNIQGVIRMKGDKFTLETPDMTVWFDGQTQWTYLPRSEEVNISTPAADDLSLTHPARLLDNCQQNFIAVYKGKSVAPNGKTVFLIALTPKKKGTIARMELLIEQASACPARILITFANGDTQTISITQLATDLNLSDSCFVFNPAACPNADIIDLR